MATILASPPVLAYATAREALEAELGLAVPARATFRCRPLLGVLANHHRDGVEGYEAEQLAGACGDAHLATAGATQLRVATVATIVRPPRLAGELAALAGSRPDSAVVVAAAWAV